MKGGETMQLKLGHKTIAAHTYVFYTRNVFRMFRRFTVSESLEFLVAIDQS